MTEQPPKLPDESVEPLDATHQPLDLGALTRSLSAVGSQEERALTAAPPTHPAPDPLAFDMDAAWLRRAEADGAAFLSRFSRIVSEALPHHATLDIVRRGLFRKTEEVVGLAVAFDDEIYRMRLSDHRQVVTELEKRVRGVTLSTKALQPAVWISGLLRKVQERTSNARAIADLLRSL